MFCLTSCCLGIPSDGLVDDDVEGEHLWLLCDIILGVLCLHVGAACLHVSSFVLSEILIFNQFPIFIMLIVVF